MSTNDNERKGFPIGNFIVKLVLIIIFVFLLCLLLPKFMVPKITKSMNGKGCATCECTGVKALTSKIFESNLEKMKEAATSYYTTERLPKNVGDSKKLTLSDMIGLKIITPLIDKNNKAVDVEKSYVKITKTNEEYILKVNIKDSEKEDYILVHIGCYDYCGSGICQKQEDVPVKAAKEDPKPTPTPEPPKEEKHYCAKYNNKYYDISGNVVSYEDYKKSCIPQDTHKCVKYDGKYYNAAGNVVSYEEYKKDCLPEEKHICVKYDGKYYDNNGKVVSYEDYKKACETKKDYIYEYKKTTAAKFSAWSLWSAWEKTNCATEEYNCNDNDPTCLMKLQRYDRKEQVGTYEKAYTTSRDVIVQTGAYEQKSCSKYDYVIIDTITYITTTTTKYTEINTIKGTSGSGWKYVGRQLFTNPPRDTATRHYKFVGADYSYCSDTCTTLPNYYYDVYEYTGTFKTITNTYSTPVKTVTKVEKETTADASCGEYIVKTIPIYSTITITDVDYREEPLYGDVCYQSTKTRNIKEKEKVEFKWSKYNDTTLLNNGWVYTGERKEK